MSPLSPAVYDSRQFGITPLGDQTRSPPQIWSCVAPGGAGCLPGEELCLEGPREKVSFCNHGTSQDERGVLLKNILPETGFVFKIVLHGRLDEASPEGL